MAKVLRKGTLIERKVMGETTLGPGPAPTPTICLTYDVFITRHERIRKFIDEAAERGECVTLDSIASALELDRETVEHHWKILRGDDYARETDERENFRVCSREALERLTKSLSVLIKKK